MIVMAWFFLYPVLFYHKSVLIQENPGEFLGVK